MHQPNFVKKYQLAFLVCVLFLSVMSCDKKDDVVPKPLPEEPLPSLPVVLGTYYVAQNGSDGRTAEQAQNSATPWRSIQKAANTIKGGDIVVIRGGTYPGRVYVPTTCNGTAEKPTVFRNHPKEEVIIEGNNIGNQWEGLFELEDNEHIIVKGIKAQNGYWYGFSADKSKHVTFDSCSTYNTRASGIFTSGCSYIQIINNNIRKACQEPNRDANGYGTQECITVGRSDNFKVSNNEVWDNEVFGAGGEGIDAKGACFDGEISFNYVHDLVRVGIYVDAGSGEAYNVRVFSNTVMNCGGGLSVAGELGGHARDIYFYNNLLVNNKNSGVLFQNIMNGRFSNIYIVNNTFYNNAQAGFSGDIANYSVNDLNSNIQILNNIFYNKTDNYRFSIFHNIAENHTIHNNLYFDFKPGYAGEPNNFTLTNLTATDIQADPQFNDISLFDFTLKPASPAISKGIPVTFPSSSAFLFTTDHNGKSREDSNWDMGAFEH